MKVQNMKSWFARVGTVAVIGTGFGVVGGLGGYVAMSYAAGQNLGEVNDYHIPYQGVLELGGVPVDGPKEFVFTLYASETSEDENDIVWVSNPRTLQVSRGYFATVLGDETDQDNRIKPAVFAEPVLYVGMKVDGVELSGRQRILAVPYAQNGAPGKTFVVDGKIQTVDLEASGNAGVAGTLRVNGKVTANNGLEVSGATTLKNNLSVTGTTAASGRITASGGLRVDGNVTTGGTANTDKLVQILYVNRDTTSSPFNFTVTTDMSSSDWNCTIGSFRFSGDINEDDEHYPLLRLYTYISNGTWYVRGQMANDSANDSKGFRAEVVCFSTKISHRIGSYTTNF